MIKNKHTKIICFDTGDQWTGIALSDPLRILAKPYTTIKTNILESFLKEILKKESIDTAVVGNPITLRGTLSDQTRKVHLLKETLKIKFPELQWILWDERFSSKKADSIKKDITPQEKQHSHARAAAFILQSYLDYYQQNHHI